MLLVLRGSPYGINDELSSSEMNVLNDQLPNAFDAVNGGAYTLVAPASIGGDFVTISNFISDTETFLNGVTHIDGVASVTVSLTIDGSSSAELDFTSGATLRGAAGSSLIWAGSTNFTGGLIANSNFQHLSGIALFAAAANFGGAVNFTAGSVTNQVTISNSGAGHIACRYVVGVDENHVYSISDADIIRVPVMTTARTYTIASAGATLGCVIEITLDTTSGTDLLSIQRDDFSTLATLQRTVRNYTKLVFDGTNWQRVFTGLIA